MDQTRSNQISIAKGMGIMLMVVGHSVCPVVLHDFIYVFHMPLFFFLSGYCFKESYAADKRTFIIHRLRGLYVPFVKYNVLFLLLHNIFYRMHLIDAPVTLGQVPPAVLRFLIMGGMEELLGPYWFLRYLLLASVAYMLFFAFVGPRHPRLIVALVALLPLAAFVSNSLGITHLLSCLFLLSLFFFASGHAFRRLGSTAFPAVAGLLCLAVTVVSSVWLKSEMVMMRLQDTLPYCLFALTGIYATLWLAKNIEQQTGPLRRLLLFLGRNTMPILTWHFLCFKLLSFLLIRWLQLPPDLNYEMAVTLPSCPWLWMVYSFVGIAVPLALSQAAAWALNRYHQP